MDVILNKIQSVFHNTEARNKVLFTLFIIFIFRLLASIPLPGLDPQVLTTINADNPFSTVLTLTTGGRLNSPSLVVIGLGSYISASILVQLLQTVIPKLEELSKEGQRGRMIITQITRYLTVPLSLLQAFFIYSLFNSGQIAANLVGDHSRTTIIAMVLAIAAGTIFLMWLSEEITERGIGNGSTVIILTGILAALPGVLPTDFSNIIATNQTNLLIGFVLGAFAVLMVVVYVGEAIRKIPIQYSSRVRSVDGGYDLPSEKSHFPLRPNMAGVMPVIFASAVASFPNYIASYLQTSLVGQESRKLYIISKWLMDNVYASNTIYTYIAIEVVFILAFTFMYTIATVKPDEIADNLKKSGAFIPGIRPGKFTAKYIQDVLLKLTLVGAVFLAVIAVSPTIARMFTGGIKLDLFTVIGGTSLLIIVSGLMEIFRQLDSLLLNRSYDKYVI